MNSRSSYIHPGDATGAPKRLRGERHDYAGKALIACLLAWVLAAPAASWAQTILEARYDPEADALVLEIAYRGTRPDHRFRLEWDACRKGPDGHNAIAARLVDQDGDDIARNDYEVTRRFELSGLDCRPADVTVRLGPVSNRTVSVPERRR